MKPRLPGTKPPNSPAAPTMTTTKTAQKTAPTQQQLLDAARAFEADVVIPHCVSCARPCCGLSDVVLELSFGQVQQLYAIERPKKDFDRALPPMIKRAATDDGDRYYAHGEPCPAYDLGTKKCRVYGTAKKPQSCSDFPVYDDDDVVTADLRCEAVHANFPRLVAALRAVAGPDLREERDEEWPDTFVSFSIARRRTSGGSDADPPPGDGRAVDRGPPPNSPPLGSTTSQPSKPSGKQAKQQDRGRLR